MNDTCQPTPPDRCGCGHQQHNSSGCTHVLRGGKLCPCTAPAQPDRCAKPGCGRPESDTFVHQPEPHDPAVCFCHTFVAPARPPASETFVERTCGYGCTKDARWGKCPIHGNKPASEECGNHSHGHPLHLCKPRLEDDEPPASHICNDGVCTVCGRTVVTTAPPPASDALPPCCKRSEPTVICWNCGDRLASPALPETVVAVLRACDRQDSEGFDEGHSDQRIDAAVRAWRAAGRPGLK